MAGSGVDLTSVTIEGLVDLTAQDRIPKPFTCVGCVFTAGIAAADVEFAARVDLSGSRIQSRLDLQGAVFHSELRLTVANGEEATIDELNISSASFDANVDVSGTSFTGPVIAQGARFNALADFSSVSFSSSVAFDATTFARADFQATTFHTAPSFEKSSAENLDFSGARFRCGFRFRKLQVAERLSFRRAFVHTTCDGQEVVPDLRDLTAGEINLELDLARSVQGEQNALTIIERDALDRGDISLANRAHFDRRKLTGRGVLDTLNREVLGYVVMPLYPVRTLIGIVVVWFAASWIASKRKSPVAALLGVGQELRRALGRPWRLGAVERQERWAKALIYAGRISLKVMIYASLVVASRALPETRTFWEKFS